MVITHLHLINIDMLFFHSFSKLCQQIIYEARFLLQNVVSWCTYIHVCASVCASNIAEKTLMPRIWAIQSEKKRKKYSRKTQFNRTCKHNENFCCCFEESVFIVSKQYWYFGRNSLLKMWIIGCLILQFMIINSNSSNVPKNKIDSINCYNG